MGQVSNLINFVDKYLTFVCIKPCLQLYQIKMLQKSVNDVNNAIPNDHIHNNQVSLITDSS